MKYGQPLSLMVYLTSAGTALTYANAAAFTAAGWIVEWLDMTGALISPQPTFTIAPYRGDGGHLLNFVTPSQPSQMVITHPYGSWVDPANVPLIATSADEDTIYAQLFNQVGTPAAAGRITISDWESAENDSFYAVCQFSTTVLASWGYVDLSAAGWTFSAAARADGDTSTGSPLFTYAATLVSGPNSQIAISFSAYPTAAVLTTSDLQAGYKSVKYDVQARRQVPFAIVAAVAGANGTLSIAGDQRKYFTTNAGSTFTVDTGANAGTYTPTAIVYNGTNTVLTVANVPSAVVAGNVVAILTLTGTRGSHRLTYQVDRS